MKTNLISIFAGLLLICNTSYSQKAAKTHFVGELYGGGIVFYVNENGKHGLIASLKDVIKDIPWCANQAPAKPFPSEPKYVNDRERKTFSSDVDGRYNTDMIIKSGYAKSAAWYCTIYSSDSNHDWYLPAIDELKTLIASKPVIDPVLNNIKVQGAEGLSDRYWSSTDIGMEPTGIRAYETDFKLVNKIDNYLNVRAIRKF